MGRTLSNEYNGGKRSRRMWKEADDEERDQEEHHGWCFIVSTTVVGVASILIPALYFWQTMGATLMEIVHSDKIAFGVLSLMILLSLIMGFILLILSIMRSVELIRLYQGKKVSETVDKGEEEEEEEKGQQLLVQVD